MAFIVVESLSPSPTLYDNHIGYSTENITTGPLYKKTYLPRLSEMSEDALTFAGLSSNGIPTINGWFDLI